jgi:uncharacterized membrane protein YdjX (TVP38/TMEM64 family)
LVIYLLGKQIPQETLRSFIAEFGPWGPIVFILLAQIPYIIAPINGIPFLIAGYYLFGVNMILLTYPIALLGFSINFYISRRWGRPFLSKFLDKKSLDKIDELAKKHGVLTLIAFRIFQGGLGDYVSYAWGLTRISYKKYFLVSALAIIPGQAVWYYFARKTNSIESFLAVNWILAATFIAAFIVGSVVKSKIEKRKP